jgi:hypothetical protein
MSTSLSLDNVGAKTTGAVTVSGNDEFELVATVDVSLLPGVTRVTGKVRGGGDLTGFRMDCASYNGGTYVTAMEDSDWDLVSEMMQSATEGLWTTADGDDFQFTFNFEGTGAVKFYAKSDDGCTVELQFGF